MRRISHFHHRHPELILRDRVKCFLEIHIAHKEWLLVLAGLVHQYSEIRNLISCPLPCRNPACSYAISVLDPFQCDPKKNLACMWDKINCSVIYTLFKINFLGKWDERGERPFLWPLASSADHHIFCAFCPVLFLLLLWTVLLGPHQDLWICDMLSDRWLNSFPFIIMVQFFTIPFPPVCDLSSFSQIFASHWLDTLQTWLEFLSHWFHYLEELPEISFWVRCFQFHTHAFQLLLFIYCELSQYLSLQIITVKYFQVAHMMRITCATWKYLPVHMVKFIIYDLKWCDVSTVLNH